MRRYNVYINHITIVLQFVHFNYCYYRAKSTSMTSGFDTVRESLFTPSSGDRPDVPNLVILITDANADTDEEKTITAAEQLKGIMI